MIGNPAAKIKNAGASAAHPNGVWCGPEKGRRVIVARRNTSQLVIGVALLAVGAVLVATRFVNLDQAPAWLLGVGFALALLGVLQRHVMPLTVGMVVLGMGAGLVLGDVGAAGLQRGAWLWLGPGLALLLLFLLRLVLGMRRSWWPLVLGVVLVVVAAARQYQGLAVIPVGAEEGVRTWWPVALMVVGLWLLVRAVGRR